MKKALLYFIMLITILSMTSCGENNNEATEETTEAVTNGVIDNPETFINLGFYIDVESSDMISDVSYEIVSDEIGSVDFIYNGINCCFRASTIYSDYELAGVENTSTGDMVATSVNGYNATYYKLNPGRVAFWKDDNINYCLYVYVTASDEVLNSITSLLIFENHYSERADVQESTDTAAIEFAEQIVTVFENKDLDALAEMMNYPQQLGSGESVANKNELLALDPDVIFTDDLTEAIADNAVAGMRDGKDEGSLVIGSNYKNIYFMQTDDGSFKITKINN